MPAPTFDDLRYTCDQSRAWQRSGHGLRAAYQDGARYGYEQARQLWPEPITDRRPTLEDANIRGAIQVQWDDGCWIVRHISHVGNLPWLPVPGWQPPQPTLRERALGHITQLLSNPNHSLEVREALQLAAEALQSTEAEADS